ncbi:MAG: hypothetical protein AAF415_07400 [Pseudomonadota bacterium]
MPLRRSQILSLIIQAQLLTLQLLNTGLISFDHRRAGGIDNAIQQRVNLLVYILDLSAQQAGGFLSLMQTRSPHIMEHGLSHRKECARRLKALEDGFRTIFDLGTRNRLAL